MSGRGLACVLAIVLLTPLPALAFPPPEVIVALTVKLVAPVLMPLALVLLPLRMMLVRLRAVWRIRFLGLQVAQGFEPVLEVAL